MLQALKSLFVILTLAIFTFALVKPICLQFMAEDLFRRRTRVWLALTVGSFLAPNLWLFAAVAIPLVYWATRLDPHPSALYAFLLLTVPPVSLPIPMPVINQLFELTYFRILSLGLLVPSMIRLMQAGAGNVRGIAKVDLLLIAFGVLQLLVYIPYESVTHTMRRTVLFFIDTYALYYVFSRGTSSKESMRDTMACFWLGIFVAAPITVFESAKGWLLYQVVPDNWGSDNPFAYLMRGDSLRAQASGGHSLIMGYLFAVAFGFWLYLAESVRSIKVRWAVGIVIWMGLIASFSRAPWIVAAAIGLLYVASSPRGLRSIVKFLPLFLLLAIPLSMTSQGMRVIESLPFVGTTEQSNVEYRQQLAQISWQLIQMNPYFGNPFASFYMEDLRQGQGIIDLVNTYAWVSLYYGLVGFAIFVACFAYPMFRAGRASVMLRSSDPEVAKFGLVVCACLIGTLIMLATCSFINGVEIVTWVLIGMCGGSTAIAFKALEARREMETSGPSIRYSESRAQ